MVFVHHQHAHARHHQRHLPFRHGHSHPTSSQPDLPSNFNPLSGLNTTISGPVKRFEALNDNDTAPYAGGQYSAAQAAIFIVISCLTLILLFLTWTVVRHWLRRRRERRMEGFYSLPRSCSHHQNSKSSTHEGFCWRRKVTNSS